MFDLTTNPIEIQCLADDVPTHLPPEALKERLGALVRQYVRDGRSKYLAHRVVHHCQALYLHPALVNQPDEQHAFRLLAQHWRRLAAQLGANTPA